MQLIKRNCDSNLINDERIALVNLVLFWLC